MCATKGCDDDENISRPRPEDGLYPFPEYRKEIGEAEENSGMDRRDKRGEQQRQHKTAAGHAGVVRSFLLHGGVWHLQRRKIATEAPTKASGKKCGIDGRSAGQDPSVFGREFCRQHHLNKREEDEQ